MDALEPSTSPQFNHRTVPGVPSIVAASIIKIRLESKRRREPVKFSGAGPLRVRKPRFIRVKAVDLPAFVREYANFYPVFQAAYRDIGYPDRYFNDRLVEVIDLLLATPDIAAPLRLKRPGVMYTFADPDLESLSAGQKILLRVGPANEALIKSRLRELRGLVTAGTGIPETPAPKP